MGFFLSYVCYAFVLVCLYVPCGHLLGKGWPLGSCLWCPTFPLVSWVRCGTWLYRFLIFAPLLTLSLSHVVSWVRFGTWLYRFLLFATFTTFIAMVSSLIARRWVRPQTLWGLTVPQVCLQFVNVVFPDHTHLLYFWRKALIGGLVPDAYL